MDPSVDAQSNPNKPQSDFDGIDLTHEGAKHPTSNGVCSTENIAAIVAAIRLINVAAPPAAGGAAGNPVYLDDPHAKKALLLFAIHCGDIGSSMNTSYYGAFGITDLPGTGTGTATGGVPAGGSLWHADIVKAIMFVRVTIRQVCMYLAPLVWNFYLTYRPPANWAKKGFTDTTKLAAFDFFSGIEHEASAPTNLIRAPTPWERTAAQTAFAVYIARAASRASGYASNAVEITRGQYLATGSRLALPAPPTSALM